ncbi:MAG: MBL fold metallo-hydrolase [Syntrophobacteraceae bacterium]|jgi:glyoxylase-like metal-dependent hydrolase (beta-lactamase superfamily II)
MKIEQIPVGYMQVFCYLVYDEETEEGILIDPAGNEEALVEHLKDKGIKLRYIVNTHGHADHTCGNEPLKKATGASVVMHATDDLFYQKPESKMFARSMGFPTSSPADVSVQDGDELSFGNLKMKFIHTPGHTPGGCCILIDGNLFTGDTLFVGAVGRTDLPGGSFKQLIQSLQDLVKTLPPDTVVWPGHDYGDRPRSTLRREAETNPYIVEYMK